MKRKFICCCISIFFSCLVYADDSDLLNEYKLLYIDLSNIKTWGYKSFFNNEINKSTEKINISQGALVVTEVKTHIAIAGEGFLKIKLENGLIGYTRSGDFNIDADGNIVTQKGYFLYDNICLGELFLLETLRITRDHTIYIGMVDENGNVMEVKTGQLLTYNIPDELLSYYKDAIYVIKDDVEFTEEITFNNNIYQGILEHSNVYLLSVVLRMYYILSTINKDLMPNIEFKKELLKIQIEKMADDDYVLYKTLSTLNYLESILPFIKYDY